METDVRKRLNEFSTVELKNMIRKYNLHHRIMLSQKKDGLIDGLISHLTSEGHILTSKPTEIDLTKYSPMQRIQKEEKARKGVLTETLTKIRDKKLANEKETAQAKAELDTLRKKAEAKKAEAEARAKEAKKKLAEEEQEQEKYGYPFYKNKEKEERGEKERILVEHGRRKNGEEYWFREPLPPEDGGGSQDCYAVRKGKVVVIGFIDALSVPDDWEGGEPPRRFHLEKAREVRTNLRFYYDDVAQDPVEELNDAQEKAYQKFKDAKEPEANKAEAKKKAVSEVSGESSSDEELEVTKIKQNGIMYLVDEDTGDVYDSKTEKLRKDLKWSKGKGVRTVEAKKK